MPAVVTSVIAGLGLVPRLILAKGILFLETIAEGLLVLVCAGFTKWYGHRNIEFDEIWGERNKVDGVLQSYDPRSRSKRSVDHLSTSEAGRHRAHLCCSDTSHPLGFYHIWCF